jgi:hypothetical protein
VYVSFSEESSHSSIYCFSWKRLLVVGIIVVLFLIFDDSKSSGKTKGLKSSAKAAEKAKFPPKPPSESDSDSESGPSEESSDDESDSSADEEELDQAVKYAMQDFDDAEEEEIKANEGLLSSALEKASDFIKIGLVSFVCKS